MPDGFSMGDTCFCCFDKNADTCYHKGFFPSQRRGAIPNMTYRMLFVLATRLKENRKSRILMLVSKGQSGSQRKKMPKSELVHVQYYSVRYVLNSSFMLIKGKTQKFDIFPTQSTNSYFNNSIAKENYCRGLCSPHFLYI